MSIPTFFATTAPRPVSAICPARTRPEIDDGNARSAFPRSRFIWPSLVFCLIAITGCYDGSALVEEVHSAALRTRLAEVDLGTYRTTMPRDPVKNAFAELELHLYGTVPRYRVPVIEEQLKAEDYRLRHEMLAAVRQATPEELADPNLTQLRARIEKVVNGILTDAPVKTIEFYDVRLYYR